MASYKVIKQVKLQGHHQATGRTHHYLGDVEMTQAAILQIAQYPNDSGYYLLYCDEESKELTDTYHDSLESAMHQATLEFQVQSTEWQSL